MKWNSPVNGEMRERQFFAFFPVKVTLFEVSKKAESRWFEKVRVREEYIPFGGGMWVVREFLPLN